MTRGFHIVKGYENKDISLPKRSTKGSAGYDIEAAEDTLIPVFKPGVKATYVKTGIKAQFEMDEVLELYNRSSNPNKLGLMLANSVGVTDADYFESEENDGHIMFMFWNMSDQEVLIKKGERIGQGVFKKVLFTDDDVADGTRLGGFGSTGN